MALKALPEILKLRIFQLLTKKFTEVQKAVNDTCLLCSFIDGDKPPNCMGKLKLFNYSCQCK